MNHRHGVRDVPPAHPPGHEPQDILHVGLGGRVRADRHARPDLGVDRPAEGDLLGAAQARQVERGMRDVAHDVTADRDQGVQVAAFGGGAAGGVPGAGAETGEKDREDQKTRQALHSTLRIVSR